MSWWCAGRGEVKGGRGQVRLICLTLLEPNFNFVGVFLLSETAKYNLSNNAIRPTISILIFSIPSSSSFHLHSFVAVCWARLMFNQSKNRSVHPLSHPMCLPVTLQTPCSQSRPFLTKTGGIFHLSLLPMKVTAWPLTAGALLRLQTEESSCQPPCQRWDSTHFHTQQQRHRPRLGSLIGPWEKTVRPKIHYAFTRWLTPPSWTCVPRVLKRFFQQFTLCTHTVDQGNLR